MPEISPIKLAEFKLCRLIDYGDRSSPPTDEIKKILVEFPNLLLINLDTSHSNYRLAANLLISNPNITDKEKDEIFDFVMDLAEKNGILKEFFKIEDHYGFKKHKNFFQVCLQHATFSKVMRLITNYLDLYVNARGDNIFHALMHRKKDELENIFIVLEGIYTNEAIKIMLAEENIFKLTPLQNLFSSLILDFKSRGTRSISEKELDTLKFIATKGVHPNIYLHIHTDDYDIWTSSLLHMGAASGNLPLVEVLLQCDLNPNITDSYGLLPIDYTTEETVQVFKLFSERKFILHKTTFNEDIQKLLLRAGSKAILPRSQNLPRFDRLTEEAEKINKARSSFPFRAMNEKLNAQFKDRAEKIKEIFKKREIHQYECKTQEEVENIKRQHPDSYIFIEDKSNGETIVTTLSDLSSEDKKYLDEFSKYSNPMLMKKYLGWELLQRQSKELELRKYLNNYAYRSINIGGINLEILDLTGAEDYRFIVNTVFTADPEKISELERGDPEFFSSTPFISACVLDKDTRAFAGGHQHNFLPPIYLVLEVPPTQIVYMGATDIGSPYACFAQLKLEYLQLVEPVRKIMDAKEAALQITNNTNSDFLPPSALGPLLNKDPMYKKSKLKDFGCVPFFSVENLMKSTRTETASKNAYCELIVKGNVFAKSEKERLHGSRVLIMDKVCVEQFLDVYENFNSASQAITHECLLALKKLTDPLTGSYKLVLVETDPLAYKNKFPLDEQMLHLQKEALQLSNKIQLQKLRLERLQEVGAVDEKLIEEEQKACQELSLLATKRDSLIQLAKPDELLGSPEATSRPKLR